MYLGEDTFFDALVNIMWEREVDIFESKTQTLGLAADIAPSCKKQLKRLRAMYDCGAMKKIEKAVAAHMKDENSDEYGILMWQAADLVKNSLDISEENAVFAVNQIIALWDGELPELELDEDDDKDENEKPEEVDESMLFLQDVTEAQTEEPEENTQPESNGDSGSNEDEGQTQESRESVVKKLVDFWCASDCEDGRPYLAACPVGWFIMIMCAAAGVFMIWDIASGDKLTAPVFLFMFSLMLAKRSYKYESAGRLSLGICAFYIIACVRALWLGSNITLHCLPLVAAALVIFNNGRFTVLFDSEKRRPAIAYPLMLFFPAAVTAGVYVVQNIVT